MALGSIFLGGLADKIGRRPTVLGCLVVMAIGMFMATTSGGVVGGIVDAGVTRCSSRARSIRGSRTSRSGASSRGSASAACSRRSTPWRRSSRIRSAATSASRSCRSAIRSAPRPAASSPRRASSSRTGARCSCSAPGVTLIVHSDRVLLHARVRALARAQAAGGRAREDQSHAEEDRPRDSRRAAGHSADVRKRSIGDIFRGSLLPITVIVTIAYFFHITTFYFIVK